MRSEQLGKNDLLEPLEGRWVTEEAGHIDEKIVKETVDFFGLLLEVGNVFAE